MGLGVGLHRIERAVETLDAALSIRESQTIALHIYKGEGIALRLSVDHHALQLAAALHQNQFAVIGMPFRILRHGRIFYRTVVVHSCASG